MQINTSQGSGFTLVEIMVVVAIVGLLAAIAIPSFIRARANSQQNACINNMRQIDSAKDQWAMENGAKTADLVVESAVDGFMRRGRPHCPAQGVYSYNPVGQPPSCSLSNLELMHVFGVVTNRDMTAR